MVWTGINVLVEIVVVVVVLVVVAAAVWLLLVVGVVVVVRNPRLDRIAQKNHSVL
jgi:hypothetical protein